MKLFVTIIGALFMTLTVQANPQKTWTCDSGFKSSLSGAYVSKLELNSNGKYDLSIGLSPSDMGQGKTVEPMKIISDLDCQFSTEHNGTMVNCTNDEVVGSWFSFTSSYSTTSSIDKDGAVSSRSYVEVIVSSGDEKVNALLKEITGHKEVVRYNVILDLRNTKCGF